MTFDVINNSNVIQNFGCTLPIKNLNVILHFALYEYTVQCMVYSNLGN